MGEAARLAPPCSPVTAVITVARYGNGTVPAQYAWPFRLVENGLDLLCHGRSVRLHTKGTTTLAEKCCRRLRELTLRRVLAGPLEQHARARTLAALHHAPRVCLAIALAGFGERRCRAGPGPCPERRGLPRRP